MCPSWLRGSWSRGLWLCHTPVSRNDCYSWHQIQCLEGSSYGALPWWSILVLLSANTLFKVTIYSLFTSYSLLGLRDFTSYSLLGLWDSSLYFLMITGFSPYILLIFKRYFSLIITEGRILFSKWYISWTCSNFKHSLHDVIEFVDVHSQVFVWVIVFKVFF